MSTVKQYDKRVLYPMLVKSYNHLYHVVCGFVNQDADKDFGLDIFQMTNIKTTKEIVTK
jgi:hypothetical protein